MTESRYRAVKAYENLEWINSRDARPLRILAEYLEPESRFEEMEIEDTIVVFGSRAFRCPRRGRGAARGGEAG